NPHCPPYLPSFGATVKQPKTLSAVDIRRLTEAALDRTRDTLGRADADLIHELRTLEADCRFSRAAATLFQQLLGRLGIVSTRPIGLPVDREPYWLRSGHPLADYQSRPELPDTAHIVIIGEGLTGASAAYHLAEPVRTRGLRVVVLDQGDPVLRGQRAQWWKFRADSRKLRRDLRRAGQGATVLPAPLLPWRAGGSAPGRK